MDNVYIEYIFKVTPKQPATEILIAELGELAFESFVENEEGVIAYIQKEDWFSEIKASRKFLGSLEILAFAWSIYL